MADVAVEAVGDGRAIFAKGLLVWVFVRLNGQMEQVVAFPDLAEIFVFVGRMKFLLRQQPTLFDDVLLGELTSALNGGKEVVIVINPCVGLEAIERNEGGGVSFAVAVGSSFVFLDAR
jgi:hypothetical protein